MERFFRYVEIKTKITSLFAFLLAIAYLFYLEAPIRWDVTAIFFGGMFLFDLTTTAINNYIDTKTNHQTLPYQRGRAKAIIFILLAISSALGIWLVLLTDWVVFLTGGVCFLVGIFYTFGPIPISRQPWGEIFSGIFYGFFIPFLILYINLEKDTFLTLRVDWNHMDLIVQWLPFIHLFLLSVAPVMTTANIMLANNICDLEKDILVKRYTLPYYLEEKALPLWAAMYYLTYGANVVMVLIGMLPWVTLVALLTFIPVQKNIGLFFKEQKKETTFMTSILNYILIMSGNVVALLLAALLY
jgi:1,4-dihydroxy-2-naphthoate octaprenyltransferase